jgi:flagellar hook-associated protein 2
MVSGISRNYISGISSGMDTDSLISQMIEASSARKYALERKKNKLSYQQSMLQDINLKLYELQTKATDLTFSKTFNSKTVESTDSKVVNATATTVAKPGTYNVKVKQLATATSVTSKAKLAGSLELGNNVSSSGKMGGSNTDLSDLGITADSTANLKITTSGNGGQTKTFNISTSANGATSVDGLIKNINNSIKANAELNGKLVATYDDKNNKIKFNLLDTKIASARIEDVSTPGSDGVIDKLFEGSNGTIELTKDIPVKESTKTINSGLNATLKNLNFTKGEIKLKYGTNEMTINMSSFDENMTVDQLVKNLNAQIDENASFNRTGGVTGNPKDRVAEFRYDESSGKLRFVATNTGDSKTLSISDNDGTSTFAQKIFGNSVSNSNFDGGKKLSEETFATPITNGVFTIDGVQISIDPTADTLQNVLSRISSMTGIEATYDSETDKISFTRRDGSNAPIGVGSSNDTSNFLSVTGMIAGNQLSAAKITGRDSSALKKTIVDSTDPENPVTTVRPFSLAEFRSEATVPDDGEGHSINGRMKISVNGTDHYLDYSSGQKIQDILDEISNIDGIESAYYDASSGKINVIGSDRGAANSISIEDVNGGTLASDLGINTTAYGSDTGSTLVGAKSLSDIKTASPLAQAGFATDVTGGTFTINGVKFTISNTQNQTVDSVVDMINNNEKVGVKAQYNPTTGEFILTSTETGNRAIAIGDASDTSNFLSVMGLTGAVQDIGKNCIYSIDSVYGGTEQVSQSNTITDAIEGLTLNFRETTVGAGEAISVKVDTESAKTAIKDFIELYNEITETIYEKLTEKKSSEQKALTGLTDSEKEALSKEDLETYESNYKVGLLQGDTTLRTIRSQMRSIMASVVPGADALYDSLTDIGISTGAVGSDYKATMVGKLSIVDEDKLDKALQSNPEAVTKLFNADPADGKGEGMGIARKLKNALDSFTKSNGLLTSRIGRIDGSTGSSQMGKQISALIEQISLQQEKLNKKEESLIKRFSQMESALNNFQSQSQSFSNQLAKLGG